MIQTENPRKKQPAVNVQVRGKQILRLPSPPYRLLIQWKAHRIHAVSYTHLDVYKRQDHRNKHQEKPVTSDIVIFIERFLILNKKPVYSLFLNAVQDVYKRQDLYQQPLLFLKY